MVRRDRRNPDIHRYRRSPIEMVSGKQSSACVGDWGIDIQDPALKPDDHIYGKPIIKLTTTATFWKPMDPAPELGKRHDADEGTGWVHGCNPASDPWRRMPLHPFGYDVRIEEPGHRLTSRSGSARRSITSSPSSSWAL